MSATAEKHIASLRLLRISTCFQSYLTNYFLQFLRCNSVSKDAN